jgi:pimeloyl-ACP methyl ester carboxylesterase
MKAIVFLCLLLWLTVTSAPVSFAQLSESQPEWYLPAGDGCNIFVQEYGHGNDTIVVLHGGFGAEHGYLLDAFKGLEQQYRLVFYDQRGSLRSPCALDKISVQKHINDLELLRKTLGLEQMTIVAHSAGTFLAMEYLRQHPTRVRGLVLMGAVPPKTPKTNEEKSLWKEQDANFAAFSSRPEIAAELHKEGLDKDTKLLTPQQTTDAWRIRFASANLYHVDRWRQEKGGRVFYNRKAGDAAAKTMPKEYDFTTTIGERGCPIWVIDGDHDLPDPSAREFQLCAKNLKTVRISVIENAGHSAWTDEPEKFSRTLKQAVASTTGSAPKSADL